MKNISNRDIEMDYLELLALILKEKMVIVYFTLIGLTIGILIAATTPKEYQTTTVTLSESEDTGQGFGQMGALAGFAGLSMPQLGGGSSAISPDMYPEIVGSKDFLLNLMKERFYFKTKGKEMSLQEYYAEENPDNIVRKAINFVFGLPFYIINLFDREEAVLETVETNKIKEVSDPNSGKYSTVSSEESNAIGQLKKRIAIEVKSKVITVVVTMPEPLISAQVNVLVLEELIEFVTQYRTAKQTANVSFVKESVEEAEAKFKEAQNNLAVFRDLNQGIVSQRARIREEQLESEFNIAFNIFNTLRQELEQSNIQLKRQRPVFTTLEKASVPLGNSKPNVPLIIIFSLFLGVFFGFIFLVLKVVINSLKSENS